ncbi:hypothetical protein Hanom_Chr09g00828471 [Helianthus anomalus]
MASQQATFEGEATADQAQLHRDTQQPAQNAGVLEQVLLLFFFSNFMFYNHQNRISIYNCPKDFFLRILPWSKILFSVFYRT